jgi:hypothetical protein
MPLSDAMQAKHPDIIIIIKATCLLRYLGAANDENQHHDPPCLSAMSAKVAGHPSHHQGK